MKAYIRHIILILVCLVSTTLAAQTRKVMNRPYIDHRPFHYGLLFGTHMQDIEFQQNGYTDEEGNQWFADGPNYEPGFTVGLLGEMRLSNHFAVRMLPSMHFGTKGITFRNTRPDAEGDNYKQHQTLRSTYMSVPIDLKFSAERFNNYRPYAMVGINPMIDLTVKKQRQLLLKTFDLYFEVGFGCDFYCPWFKFIPELKFCYGLMNVVNNKRTDLSDPKDLIFSQSIDKGKSKMIVLTFYFE